jgi:hypothetical protein
MLSQNLISCSITTTRKQGVDLLPAHQSKAKLQVGRFLKHCQCFAVQGCTLAMVAGGGKIYLWTPAGASIVHVPLKNFASKGLAWNPRGASLCLTDTDAFCCAYMTNASAPEMA